jgi:hypothetical protein
MLKIASKTLDVVDAVLNEEIEKLAELVETLSDEAKEAYIPSYEEQHEGDDSDCALILWNPHQGMLKKYANHTAALTEINMAFLVNNIRDLPEELVKVAGANLTCAANRYGVPVPSELEPYKSKVYVDNMVDIAKINEVSFMKKQAGVIEEPKVRFAWEEEQKYDISDQEGIEKAASYFEREHYGMDMAKKLEFVLNVSSAAKDEGVSLDDTLVSKYAHLDNSRLNKDFGSHINVRKSYLADNDEDFTELYNDLRDSSEELGVIKTAQVLYRIDKLSGITHAYGKGVECPVMSCLSMPKVAFIMLRGVQVTPEKLRSLSNEDLTGIVGNDNISAIKGDEGLEVLASMPNPVIDDVISLMD